MKRILLVVKLTMVALMLSLIVMTWRDLDKDRARNRKLQEITTSTNETLEKTQKLRQFSDDADHWTADCVRQGLEDWDGLKCESRRQELLKRYQEMGEVRP